MDMLAVIEHECRKVGTMSLFFVVLAVCAETCRRPQSRVQQGREGEYARDSASGIKPKGTNVSIE
jgi:hypothetical protein